ncbi:MAG: hypothetical protein LKI32_06350 [Lachnospiraceae bacterium]|jgi:hypothetical protein|nr:hypothetical protein [Lachnospiraceae bacterium]MCI1657160.1 hypothetical protein [Lachnospiraceae bacterium]MCI2195623.1 hypothetical protein [Lachnospiraceae bacterium]
MENENNVKEVKITKSEKGNASQFVKKSKKKWIFIIAIIAVLAVIIGFFYAKNRTKQVKDMSYTITYNSKKYVGSYTGLAKNGLPVEEGRFQSGSEGDSNYLIYEGSWKDGKMIGNGTLSTNNYVLKNKDDGSVTGNYSGEISTGIANGNGTFTAKDNSNKKYSYSGEWKSGLWDGQGELAYSDRSYWFVEKGNFTEGEYDPSFTDLIAALGTRKDDCEFSLSDADRKYLKLNQKAFKKHKTSLINNKGKKFSLSGFKYDDDIDPTVTSVSGLTVFQMQKIELGGKTLTRVLLADDLYDNPTVYSTYYYGKLKKINEGTRVSIDLMPLGYSTYKGVNNSSVWSVVGLVSEINKK